jgi:hypothetical protein
MYKRRLPFEGYYFALRERINIQLLICRVNIFMVLFSFCTICFSQAGKKLFFTETYFMANSSSRIQNVSLAELYQHREYKAVSLLFMRVASFRKPFFCRLEDNLCNRFGIWIKFRAGSDEIYRKQVAIPEKQVREKDGQINQL